MVPATGATMHPCASRGCLPRGTELTSIVSPGGPYPPCWWRPLCRPTQGPQTSPNIRGTRVPPASATLSSGDHSPLGSLITVMRGRRQSAGNLIPLEPSQCPACTGCLISTLKSKADVLQFPFNVVIKSIYPPTPLAVGRVETTKVAWTHGAWML